MPDIIKIKLIAFTIGYKRKMMNYIKNVLGDTANSEDKQSVSVEKAKKYHGGRAYAEVLNYEAQR